MKKATTTQKEEISLEDEFSIDEDKFGNSVKMKRETEFFKEESHVPHELVGIRRVGKKTNIVWNIMVNKKVVMSVAEDKFSKKQKTFLNSPAGLSFMLRSFKEGSRTISDLKKKLKEM